MTLPQIYGLIGYPVKHSLSPAMHNAAFKSLGINAEYKLFPLQEGELKDFFGNLQKNNICGFNVTVPYKEKAIPFLNSLSSEAKLIGAVNTIKVFPDRLEGFNTDGQGFLKHLAEDLKFYPQGKIIAIIGAGGAIKAVSVYLAKANPKKISIYDIDQAKAAALVEHLKNNFKQVEFNMADSITSLGIENSDLLINGVPIGMKESDPCLVDKKFLHQGILAYDLIYNPSQTKLLTLAKDSGANISNGLGMLLYQGMLSFEIWTGKKPPKEIMQKALLKEL